MRTYLFAAALAASVASPAAAVTITDPAGDFAPGYTAADASLDVRSFTVVYDGTTKVFSLSGTMNGVILPGTAGFYIIGANTGTGPSAPFAAQGAPDVRFNQTIRVNKDGTGTVTTNGVITNLTAVILGNAFSVDVPLSLLPTTGFLPQNYGFNLWPRGPNVVGSTTTFVTDFSPDNGTLAASAPEPAAWALMILGFGLVGAALRYRRRPVRTRATLAV